MRRSKQKLINLSHLHYYFYRSVVRTVALVRCFRFIHLLRLPSLLQSVIDFMEENGAHEADVARLDAAYERVIDASWVEREAEPGGRSWYHNLITGEETWEVPAQYSPCKASPF